MKKLISIIIMLIFSISIASARFDDKFWQDWKEEYSQVVCYDYYSGINVVPYFIFMQYGGECKTLKYNEILQKDKWQYDFAFSTIKDNSKWDILNRVSERVDKLAKSNSKLLNLVNPITNETKTYKPSYCNGSDWESNIRCERVLKILNTTGTLLICSTSDSNCEMVEEVK